MVKQIPKTADEAWIVPSGLAETMTKLSRKESIRSPSAILVRMCEMINKALELAPEGDS